MIPVNLPSLRTVLIVLGIFAALALVMAVRGCSSAKTEAKLATGQAGAAIKSGGDAVQTIGNQMTAETASDAITKENTDAIRSAPGANAPVTPTARDAGLRALCRRAAYRGDPKCVQFAPAH